MTKRANPDRERLTDAAESLARREALGTFCQMLRRETHVLARHPESLFQQVYNRLQWVDDSVAPTIAPQRDRRDVRGGRAWVRTLAPFRESEALIHVLTGHDGSVNACAFSPDGTRVVSASSDATLKLWEVRSGADCATLRGHTGSVNACAFSPDGTRIVSASSDTTLKVWDTHTGMELATLRGHPLEVSDCDFSPDDRWIVSIGIEDKARLWDAQVYRERECPEQVGYVKTIGACAFSPNGARVVSASYKRRLKLWWRDKVDDPTILKGHTDDVGGCAFSPDGMRVASASKDGTLRTWSTVTGLKLTTMKSHTWNTDCAFSPDGSRIISAGFDGSVRLWETQSGAELTALAGHTLPVNACAFSPDGSRILSASADGTLRLWDAQGLTRAGMVQGHGGEIRACAFSPDGSRIATASADQTLRVWDAQTRVEIAVLEGHTGEVCACAFSPDGRRIVSGGGWHDDTLKIWDSRTGEELASWADKHGAMKTFAAFTPDGAAIISWAFYENALRIQDARTGDELVAPAGEIPSWVYALSPDGAQVVFGGVDDSLKVWDAKPSTPQITLVGSRGGGGIGRCAFDAAGDRIIAAVDKELHMWDARTGDTLQTFSSHSDEVRACVISPDGRWVYSASSDKTCRLWDAETGNPAATVFLPGSVSALAVHPWLPRVACGDVSGSVNVLEFVDVRYGPIIVSAFTGKAEATMRCPACWHVHPVDLDQLGATLSCPTPSCGLVLKINAHPNAGQPRAPTGRRPSHLGMR